LLLLLQYNYRCRAAEGKSDRAATPPPHPGKAAPAIDGYVG
jgi:hypothetical protein